MPEPSGSFKTVYGKLPSQQFPSSSFSLAFVVQVLESSRRAGLLNPRTFPSFFWVGRQPRLVPKPVVWWEGGARRIGISLRAILTYLILSALSLAVPPDIRLRRSAIRQLRPWHSLAWKSESE